MSDYTPSTMSVRDAWAFFMSQNSGVTLGEACAQFDRWHAAELRKAKAKALNERLTDG